MTSRNQSAKGLKPWWMRPILWTAFVAIATVFGFSLDMLNVREQLFPWPWETTAWNRIPFGQPGSCEALTTIQDGYYERRSKALLANKHQVLVISKETRLINFEGATALETPVASSEVVARKGALGTFRKRISKLCSDFAQVDGSMPISAISEATETDAKCGEAENGGYQCWLSAPYACSQKQAITGDVCGQANKQPR